MSSDAGGSGANATSVLIAAGFSAFCSVLTTTVLAGAFCRFAGFVLARTGSALSISVSF
ncbi:MAG: hypothetical protein AAFO68_07025 [Pseudomonadota bacterium]